jgi:hypothetical protein
MAADRRTEKAARNFIDSALAERNRLGYTRKISKKSYGRAVDQAAEVFETLARTNPAASPGNGAPGAGEA